MNRNHIWSTNLRFNLEKDMQRKAWEYLQTMDRQVFKSYSQVIAVAVVDFFVRYYRKQDDPYLETREREERFVSQIVTAVQTAMEKSLPVFLAGCMAGAGQVAQPQNRESVPPLAEDAEPEPDIDWNFLGE